MKLFLKNIGLIFLGMSLLFIFYSGKKFYVQYGFKKNRYYSSKGGVGIVKDDIFVVTRSSDNSIIIDHQRWRGLPSDKKQVVFVFKGKVFEANDLPDDFSIHDSILFSFEGSKVFIFDYSDLQGGYYNHGKADD